MLFSSFGFCSPVLRDRFAQVIAQDEQLRQKTCLVMPYAGFDADSTFAREREGLMEFGFDGQKIVYVRSPEDVIGNPADYIYVPGGDPFRLLQAVNERGLRDAVVRAVRDTGAVYIGVSAGAYLATPHIGYVMQLEDNNVADGGLDALCLVPDSLICHSDHYSFATLRACQEAGNRPVRTIGDVQLLLYENGVWSYIGDEL